MNVGVPVTWVAPPGWPSANAGWHPHGEWLPDPTWPWPPPDHLYWEPTDRAGYLTSDDVVLPSEPDLSDIPLVWVPAPGWPTPAAGWYPDDRWKPDKAWPRAPQGFQHWRPDPTLIAARRQRWWEETVAAASMRLASLRARVNALWELERRWTATWVAVRMLTPPLPIEAHFGAILALHHPARVAVVDAQRAALHAAHEERQQLLDPSSDRVSAERYARAAYHGEASFRLLRLRLSELGNARLNHFVTSREAALGTKSASDPGVRYRLLTELRAGLEAYEVERNANYSNYMSVLFGERDRLAPTFDRDAAWRRAEECAAGHLRSLGFADAAATEIGADAGFDVVGRTVVAQVKYLASAVGRPVVQQIVGANTHGAVAVMYSRSGYTKQALEFADQAGVALFTLELPNAVQAVNRHALQMLGNS